ncbi:hypothetical protein [Flavobacterium sp. UBA7680]|uniref:hypothetical protein n=1 Tax=Flavobacterium sp. UBA7680 TaxID=1946559 RepID=UPI0025B864D9|nr:hypothetical protein [Flavobacterium sp. UBA7680]
MPFLVFGTIVLVAGCDNEENDTGQLISENAKIDQAKNWFQSYKSNSTTNKSEEGEFNKAFRNLDYYWENAKVIQLSDNSTGITVPIKDNPEDPDYKGQKMLYLYESDSKYQALIQEIFPELQDKIDDAQKKQGFEDLTFFSGYIIHWDLKKGFLKGAKLKEGLVIEDVQDVIMLFDKDHKHSSTSKMIEMFDESANYGGERDDTLQRGGTAAIPLNNVIVTQKSPAPAPRDFSIAGAFGGDGGSSGYSGTPTGGGGSGGESGLVMPPPPDVAISDIKKFLSCFSISVPVKLTVYAERMGGGNGVGHAFIGISQGSNSAVYGYYPKTALGSLSGKGIMGENGGHHYNVSASMTITGAQLSQIIALSEVYQSKWYDLSFNNCSDFATDVLNIAGVSTSGMIDTPNTVASILSSLANHTTESNNAPKTNKSCP